MKSLSLLLALFLGIAGPAAAAEAPTPPTQEELAKYNSARAIIETTYGKMVVRFFPDSAPIHVKNFITLAESGFYDGTTFHRIIPKFMIQGGDPKGNGTGGPGYTIPGEFSRRKHVAGILSMARRKDPDSGGSQFFVMVDSSPQLDGKYSIFGELAEGLDVAQRIAIAARDRRDKPLEPITMKVSVTY